MARKTRQVETRMVSEYLAKEYSKFEYIISQPLGVVSEELQAELGYTKAINTVRPFRPSADAIVILPRYLVLVEAKVWSVVNGLAKLPLYKSLVPLTPELKQYMPREVLMELVVGWTNPNLEIMARGAGVTLKLYTPQWLVEVVEDMHKYWTAEYRQNREQKLRMREYFGVD